VNVNHLNTSRVVSAQLRGIVIHPNPGNAEMQVTLASAADQGWQVSIADLTGRILSEQQINPGNNSVKINTGDLSQGCYMVLVSHNGHYVATEKWIKNR
jgi:hypothetical protein